MSPAPQLSVEGPVIQQEIRAYMRLLWKARSEFAKRHELLADALQEAELRLHLGLPISGQKIAEIRQLARKL
jgi:DNA polymerase III psi subunit